MIEPAQILSAEFMSIDDSILSGNMISLWMNKTQKGGRKHAYKPDKTSRLTAKEMLLNWKFMSEMTSAWWKSG